MNASTRIALFLATCVGLASGTAQTNENKAGNDTDQRSMMRFQRLDKDQSGGLSFEEFSTMLRMRLSNADANNDGKISADELSAAFGKMGGAGNMADRFMRRFDINGDGVLTANEIQTQQKRMFARLDKNGDGSLEPSEMPKRRQGGGPGMQGGPDGGQGGAGMGKGGAGMGQGGGVPGLDQDDGEQE